MQQGEPFGQTGSASPSGLRREASSVLPQDRGRNTGYGSELDGVTDEPALEPAGRDFGMELAGERVASEAERLVWADLCRSEKLGTLREVEGVAVPV